MVSLDLQDAYFQVLVHLSSRHFLRFCVGDSVLQFRALCYGLSTAPQVFTRVMAPISPIMHRYGFGILRYWTTGSCAVDGPAIQGSGAHSNGSVLASTPLVSRPSGASGGCSSVPSTVEGSTQTALLPSFPPEPPRASSDCVSYIERSARIFSFTSLARCRRTSTRVSYQATWTVFRTWCCCHGHSVSHPSIPKIASFLLYLCRSLSLSYSSIASYCSMLSGVFRFVLPELPSHFVLRDLLRSFCLECSISSSRVLPWDLSRVLSFLRYPPFESLSSCSLWDL